LPGKHLTDTGYLDAELLVSSQKEYGVDLIGPTRLDYRWQAKAAEGFAASDFRIDWEGQQATSPEGHTSTSWSPAVDRGHNEVIKVKFKALDCGVRQPGALHAGAQAEHHCAAARAVRGVGGGAFTGEIGGVYGRVREACGGEGTISQGVRACGLRRSRYVGEAKTHLQHLATAAAINVNRIGSWLLDKPREQTRTSTFAKLMGPPCPNC
jgi:transposase